MREETKRLIDKIKEGEKSTYHQVTKAGIFNIQVCSTASESVALEWVREFSPAGTTGNWQKQDKLKPVLCADGNGRTHYVFNC